MDQNQLNALDPKLREAYQKVMNTPVATQTTTTKTVETTQVVPPPAPVVVTETTVSEPVPVVTVTEPTPVVVTQTPPAAETVVVQTPPPAVTPVVEQTSAAKTQVVREVVNDRPVFADSQVQAYVANEVAGTKQSIQTIHLLYIAGSVIFFIVYAIFWMQFFNIATPFGK